MEGGNIIRTSRGGRGKTPPASFRRREWSSDGFTTHGHEGDHRAKGDDLGGRHAASPELDRWQSNDAECPGCFIPVMGVSCPLGDLTWQNKKNRFCLTALQPLKSKTGCSSFEARAFDTPTRHMFLSRPPLLQTRLSANGRTQPLMMLSCRSGSGTARIRLPPRKNHSPSLARRLL